MWTDCNFRYWQRALAQAKIDENAIQISVLWGINIYTYPHKKSKEQLKLNSI